MKRQRQHLLLLLAATTLLAACSGVENTDGLSADDWQTEPQAVTFSAYVNRGTTRAGATGTLTVDGSNSTTSLQTAGFGVFAYYTDNHVFGPTAVPNFMYNQQVTGVSASNWTYSPVKYWPNETGATAMSYDTDHLSFFAYAPYAAADASTGCVTGTATEKTTGIVAMSRPSDSGDPWVRYYASLKPTEAVDLCWAAPSLNETKPAVGSTVDFNFKHALAALNVQIDADIDVVPHAASSLDTYTRIYVRSITFEGFAEKGQLDLNNSNSAPRWNNLDCDCDLTSDPITVYDGRRDGHEGMAASLNETHAGLNPVIVQSGKYTVTPGANPGDPVTLTTITPGVTNTVVNLFDPTGVSGDAAAAPIYVIPTGDKLRVTIVYDVETYDPKLVSQHLADGETHGSSIKNTIAATIKTSGDADIIMEAGKQYTISLHLGMTSVKVNADVTPWPEDGVSATVNLPNNE